MVKRQTWVLLVVFLVFVGLAILWTRIQEDRRKSNPTQTPTPQQQLFTIDSAVVASLRITENSSGRSVMVARDMNGQWTLVEPETENTDVASIEAAVTQLSNLNVLATLDTSDNLAEYGLDKPVYTILVNMNGGQQYTAQVGSTTATSNGYYVLIPGSLPQIVAKYGLDAVLKLWQNPPVTTPTTSPTQTGTVESTIESPPTQTPLPSTQAPQATDTPIAATPTDTAEP